jgi:predicted nuclease of predicted toxin-antitoxin system
MKFVVDENVSFGLVEALRKNREEVFAIVEDNRGISDTDGFNLARKDKAVLITRDYHFTNPMRFASSKVEAVVYIQQGNLFSVKEIQLVMNFLRKHTLDQFKGKLVTLYKDSAKIR